MILRADAPTIYRKANSPDCSPPKLAPCTRTNATVIVTATTSAASLVNNPTTIKDAPPSSATMASPKVVPASSPNMGKKRAASSS